MALRSLALRLKALPLRAPASSRAFATQPKGDLSSQIEAALDRTKYKSAIQMFEVVNPMVEQQAKFSRDQYLKSLKLYRGAVMFIAAGGVGTVYLSLKF